ncbi:hypothetical protein ACLOJK_028310 [Asimina triloba]
MPCYHNRERRKASLVLGGVIVGTPPLHWSSNSWGLHTDISKGGRKEEGCLRRRRDEKGKLLNQQEWKERRRLFEEERRGEGKATPKSNPTLNACRHLCGRNF